MKLKQPREPHGRLQAREVLVRESPGASLVFDPRVDLLEEEVDWMKQEAENQFSSSKRTNRLLATTWMRWRDPDHLEWLRTQRLAMPELWDLNKEKTLGEEAADNKDGYVMLAKVLEIFPEKRVDLGAYPDVKQVFQPEEHREAIFALSLVISLIKLWPDKQQQIIQEFTTTHPTIQSTYVEQLSGVPPGTFLEAAARLVLIFPEFRSEVEKLVRRRAVELRQALVNAAQKAKHPSPTAPFDPFMLYQRMLSALVILESGQSFFDAAGEIQLRPRSTAMGRGEGLPDRPQV